MRENTDAVQENRWFWKPAENKLNTVFIELHKQYSLRNWFLSGFIPNTGQFWRL